VNLEENRQKLLIVIVSRLILVSFVMGLTASASAEQTSFARFLQAFVLSVYLLSALYLVLWRRKWDPDRLYLLQFAFDLVLITWLIFASGGIDSPFTPFYVLIIVYATLLKHRRGGVLGLMLCIASYVGIAHLGFFGVIPGKELVSYTELMYRVLLNVLAFVSVTLLGMYLSERLHNARRELGAARALHWNIVNSIRTGLLTLDTSGNITSLNRAAESITGFRQSDLLSMPLSHVFPASITGRILNSQFHSGSRPLRLECWIGNGRPKEAFLGISCSPLVDEAAERIGYVLSFQDLTEIHRREEELQIKEKMAAIGQIAAGLAHEIRNPLGSLSGSIQILSSELALSADQARLIEIILRECDRLNKIVGDFLAYAGARPCVRQPVDLVPVIQDAVELFKNNPEFKPGHRIDLSAPPTLTCEADADQIRQAVWNILQNAVRAMPEGGKLAIRISRNHSRVTLSFADEGVGMTAEEKKMLFQPFHSGFRKGAGLGMAIVYQIVQQHRGSIQVKSRRSKGTAIDLSFPAAAAERTRPHRFGTAGKQNQAQLKTVTALL
jgi:two-component system, NtrC family, sensor histidine kinase PilS